MLVFHTIAEIYISEIHEIMRMLIVFVDRTHILHNRIHLFEEVARTVQLSRSFRVQYNVEGENSVTLQSL